MGVDAEVNQTGVGVATAIQHSAITNLYLTAGEGQVCRDSRHQKEVQLAIMRNRRGIIILLHRQLQTRARILAMILTILLVLVALADCLLGADLLSCDACSSPWRSPLGVGCCLALLALAAAELWDLRIAALRLRLQLAAAKRLQRRLYLCAIENNIYPPPRSAPPCGKQDYMEAIS